MGVDAKIWAMTGRILLAAIAIPSAWAQPSEALVFDGRGRDLYHVDLFTGDRTLVSGTRWNTPRFVLSEAAGTALVFDTATGAIDRVDPVLDTVQTLPSAEVFGITAVAASDATHAVAALLADGAIVKIDTATGATETLSAVGTGQGPLARRISALVVEDPDHLLVTQSGIDRRAGVYGRDGLYRVDLATGDWTALVLAELASEPTENVDLVDPRAIFPGDSDQVTLLETNPPGLTLADTASGPLFNTALYTEGEGPPLAYPLAAIRRDSQTLWVLDHHLSGVCEVNTVTGARTLLSQEGGRGTGPALDHPLDMALAPGGGHLWVLTGRTSQRLVAVDVITGDREVIFESSVGEGPLPEIGPLDMIPRGDAAVLALVNGGRHLMEIDLATGDRSLVTEFDFPVRRIASGPGQDIWGVRSGDLLRIHPATASLEVVDLGFDPSNGRRFFNDVVQVSPRQLVLADLGASIQLWEFDPLGSSPTLTPLYDHPETASPSIDHLAFIDEDNFVFIDYRNINYWSPSRRPGIFRFTRGDAEITEVSSPTLGGGAPIVLPHQLAVDETNDVWIVVGDPPALLRVDMLSGLRTEISGPSRGAGPLWQLASSLVLTDGLPPLPLLDRILGHILGTSVLSSPEVADVDTDQSGDLNAADVVLTVGR